MKTFNTAGLTRPDEHYTVSPLSRWDMEGIRRLIGEKRYFVLHAPRQTGKTSCLLALMEQLNAEEECTALYVNLDSPGRAWERGSGDVHDCQWYRQERPSLPG